MSIFHLLRGSSAEPELSPELKKRLLEIEERQRLQEKGLKTLELEWQEWLDKFRLMYARLSARIKQAADVNHNTPESSQDAPGATNRPHLGYGQGQLPERRVRRNY